MPLFWLSLAFLSGILLGDLFKLPWSAWLGFSAGSLALALFSIKAGNRLTSRLASWVCLPLLRLLPEWSLPRYSALWLVLAVSLGGLRFAVQLPQLSPEVVAWYAGWDSPLVIEGVVVAPPEERGDATLLRVRAQQLHASNELVFHAVKGDLLARVAATSDWQYGDRVRLQGMLKTPPADEEFSYREYLYRQGIYAYFSCYVCQGCAVAVDQTCARLLQRNQGSTLQAAIYVVREKAHQLLIRFLPEPEASVLSGILLGIESGIPEEVYQAFRDTGTAHIIAISGFNFAIVAALFSGLLLRLLGRWRGMLVAFLAIAVYAVLAGANAAVIRAAIMGGLSVFALQLGRRQQGVNTLLIVAGGMALADPNVLWDVGFQLSFMATLGLVLYAQPLQEWFTGWAGRFLPEASVQRLAGPVGEYFLFTLAAQVTTLPVIIYHFQRLSLVSFLANPLILPAQPAVMILGGVAAILGLIYLPIGQLAAYLVWPFLAYTTRLVEEFARIGNIAWALGKTTLLVVVLFYAGLFGLTLVKNRPGRPESQKHTPPGGIIPSWGVMGVLLVLLASALLTWQAVFLIPDGHLNLTLLDVGSGDALLIQTPGGRSILVDGGPGSTRLSDALGRRLPLWNRTLDYLVVAGTSPEQIGALPYTVERFVPQQVLWAGPPAGDAAALQLRKQLVQEEIPVITAQVGQVLELGQGAELRVLAVTRRGAVYLLEWQRFRCLLPVGIEFESLQALMSDRHQGPVTALLLADSGYAPLTPPEWIERWKPQLVLLSVGAGDYDGRPAPEVLEAVDGYPLLRTDLNGWIKLSTDGEQMWVEVERQ